MTNGIRDLIEAPGALPKSGQVHRKGKPCFSKTLYRQRNLVDACSAN